MPLQVTVLMTFFFLGLVIIPLACMILAKSIYPGTTADAEARRIIAYWGVFFMSCWLLFVGFSTLIAIGTIH